MNEWQQEHRGISRGGPCTDNDCWCHDATYMNHTAAAAHCDNKKTQGHENCGARIAPGVAATCQRRAGHEGGHGLLAAPSVTPAPAQLCAKVLEEQDHGVVVCGRTEGHEGPCEHGILSCPSRDSGIYAPHGMGIGFAPTNPKTLMGRRKVPMLSVIPPSALAYLGAAMRYGALEAPRADESKGYGPYNWRDQPVEMMTYVDAALRHLGAFVDGEDCDPLEDQEGNVVGSGLPHLAHALATIAILVDAIENATAIDDRPKVRKGAFSEIIKRYTRKT